MNAHTNTADTHTHTHTHTYTHTHTHRNSSHLSCPASRSSSHPLIPHAAFFCSCFSLPLLPSVCTFLLPRLASSLFPLSFPSLLPSSLPHSLPISASPPLSVPICGPRQSATKGKGTSSGGAFAEGTRTDMTACKKNIGGRRLLFCVRAVYEHLDTDANMYVCVCVCVCALETASWSPF